MSQIDITVYLVYYLVSVFIVSFDNVIYTCCHLAITSVFSRAALPIMANKQLHVKWPRALLRFISVRLENPNKIAIAILSSTPLNRLFQDLTRIDSKPVCSSLCQSCALRTIR